MRQLVSAAGCDWALVIGTDSSECETRSKHLQTTALSASVQCFHGSVVTTEDAPDDVKCTRYHNFLKVDANGIYAERNYCSANKHTEMNT